MKEKGVYVLSGIILAFICIVLIFAGNPGNMAFCIACFIRDSAGAMKMHQAAVVQYFRPEIVGLLLGSFIIAVIKKEYRSTAGSAPMVRFFLGFTMMVGALVFLGCPLRMLIRMGAGDLNAYVGFVGFILGVLTGVYALRKGFSLGRAYETSKISGAVLPLMWTAVFIIFLAVPSLFAFSEKGPGSMHAPIFIALLCGVVFGIIAQRIRMCTIGMIRDAALTGTYFLGIIAAVFVATLIVFNLINGSFKLSFAGQPIAHSMHLWNILGLYTVGLAGVLAGGCPLRQIILAGQGSSDAAVTFIGMLVGAAACHNFSLASAAASAESAGGPSINGKIALIICLLITLFIAFTVKGRKTVIKSL